MSNDLDNNKYLMTISEAARFINIKPSIVRHQIEEGNIVLIDGKIEKSICERIAEQKSNLIGIKAFLNQHNSERFDARHAKDRNRYIDFFENNRRFGIETINADTVFYDNPWEEDFYITKEDAQFLEYKSEEFFQDVGRSEKEIINRIISSTKDHIISAKYIKEYLSLRNDESFYTASLTIFVKTIFDLPDVMLLTDEDILSVIEETDIKKTKAFLVDFFKFVSKYENVRYHDIEIKKKESNSMPAYSYDEYVRLAKVLFNENYCRENNLVEKALANSKYAEMWLYLSAYYICDWRSAEICNEWIYPDIKNNKNPFNINIDTLKEDILDNKITDETYEKIALYCVKRIEMANKSPKKTGLGKLRLEITPELRPFFGKLILIAEHHHFLTGAGYMKANRVVLYQNWITAKEFFGEGLYDIIGKKNIHSRRLNKCYTQGIEKTTRDNGYPTLVAHVIASFARNHSNVDTTAIYLRDHGLTGETAEVVLYMMMQRGVFGVSLYSALIAAYPEAFEKLTPQEQTAIMAKIPLSAYELETVGEALVHAERIADVFAEGKTEEPKEILRIMYAITQGRGKSKDPGVFCKRKALGLSCCNPTYESCIANLCPYHIFTSEGIPALIRVIKEYRYKASNSDNDKYKVALNTKIIPAFQEIINEIIKEMSDVDKRGTKKLIEEALHG